MNYDLKHAMSNRPDCRVPKNVPNTVTKIIASHEQKIADYKALAKRFPEAYQRAGEWVSPGITSIDAKNFKICWVGDCIKLHFYVTVRGRTKDSPPINVFAEKSHEVTKEHIVELLENNPRIVFKDLNGVLACQD